MSAPWVLVDVPCLAWQAYHGRAHGDPEAACAHAVDEGRRLASVWRAERRLVWCFDAPPYRRTEAFSGYKSGRPDSPEREAVRDSLELAAARLPKAAVRRHSGYEADDHVAAAVRQLPAQGEDAWAIIVSRDGDLLQLLRRGVTLYDPVTKATTTTATFRHAHPGLHPAEWPDVKALAGDPGDSIPGLPGVGLVLAERFLSGKMKAGSATFRRAEAYVRTAEYARNLALVRLPLPGCPEPPLVEL